MLWIGYQHNKTKNLESNVHSQKKFENSAYYLNGPRIYDIEKESLQYEVFVRIQHHEKFAKICIYNYNSNQESSQ
jgi:hypothetical protein